MTPNPILKVLSTLNARQVQYLLMGGQACVLYGAAEFSRDTDIAVLAAPGNLHFLEQALQDLNATCIALPPFSADYLRRGFAVHFRSRIPEAAGMRIDIMSVMRGVAPFPELWARRTTLDLENGLRIEMLSLPDLLQAKKTQRDKDWPMIRRLIEAHYAHNQDQPSPEQVVFWLREARTPLILQETARRFPDDHADVQQVRPLLAPSILADYSQLAQALAAEEQEEREADRAYWLPRRAELESLRRQRQRSSRPP